MRTLKIQIVLCSLLGLSQLSATGQGLEEFVASIQEVYTHILDTAKMEQLALELYEGLETDDSDFVTTKYQLLVPIFENILGNKELAERCKEKANITTSTQAIVPTNNSATSEWTNVFFPTLFTNEDPNNAKKALTFLEKNPSIHDFNKFNYVAYAFENNGDYVQAKAQYERALTFVENEDKQFFSFSFYTNFLSRSGEYLKAETFIKRIEDLANRTSTYIQKSYLAESLTTKTVYYSYLGDYNSYIDASKKQYAYFDTLWDPSIGCNPNPSTLSTITAHSFELLADHKKAKELWQLRDEQYNAWVDCHNERFPQARQLPLSVYPIYLSKTGALGELANPLDDYISEVNQYYASFQQYATINIKHYKAQHLGFLYSEDYHSEFKTLLEDIKVRRDFTEATLPFSYYAYFCARDRNFGKADLTYREMFELNADWIDDLISTFGEKAFVTYYNTKIKQGYDNYHSYVKILHDRGHPSFQKAIAQDYNNLLMTKSIGFKGTLKKKNLFLRSNNKEVRDLYNNWLEQKRNLINFYQQLEGKDTIGNAEAETARGKLQALQREVDQLENKLAVKGKDFKKYLKIEQPDWRQIKKGLKENEVAIEMVRFDWRDQLFYSDSAYYAAYIIRKNSSYPDVVYLPAQAQELDTRFYKGYQNFIRLKQEDLKSFDNYWKPIQDQLEGIEKVYFSPDGIFHLINLPTLKNPGTGKYLLEELEVQYVTSTSSLLKSSGTTVGKTVLFGRPQYNLTQPAIKEDTSITRSFVRNFRGQDIADLPGSEEEVLSIHEVLRSAGVPVEYYLGDQATEDQIYALENPGILHIATHGYWSQVESSAPGYRMFNAMVNSGLLLAGVVNYYREPNYLYTNDGILTAYEAQNLNLENTQMVILSACETGLGDFDAGEGVYGLQRAFRSAGAKSIVTSLWKVDDAATRDFMIRFYQSLFSGEDKFEAFRSAQMHIKEKYTYPYFWGAFVLSGI